MLQHFHAPLFPLAATLTAACVALCGAGCAGPIGGPRSAERSDQNHSSTLTVLRASEVEWGALNPARGDSGPRAADLWGDRTAAGAAGATGFLVRFADGFSSPPHIHNTTYRGLVIEGLIHNDDPGAEESWMSPGSYWTQPAGESHITSAEGEGRLAYIEIQRGPYLVMPAEEAVDSGERAINVHADNLVWLDASTSRLIRLPAGVAASAGPRVSFLWGDPQGDEPHGSLVELPAGSITRLTGTGGSLRVVVIRGEARLQQPGSGDRDPIAPGGFVGSTGPERASTTWESSETTWLYVRSSAPVEIAAERVNANNRAEHESIDRPIDEALGGEAN